MKYKIQDPEETEKLLLDAGFSVGVRDTKFVVSLNNRRASRSKWQKFSAAKSNNFRSQMTQ